MFKYKKVAEISLNLIHSAMTITRTTIIKYKINWFSQAMTTDKSSLMNRQLLIQI
jgi:hypothetical protein